MYACIQTNMGAVPSLIPKEEYDAIWEQVQNYNGKVDNFVSIMQQVKKHNCETALGEAFRIWKLSCLYAQTACANNDLGYRATDIITEFMTEESRIKRLPEGDNKDKLINCIYLGTQDKKYLKVI